jgi:glycosyltransferase involved in cell wall biosynthesis
MSPEPTATPPELDGLPAVVVGGIVWDEQVNNAPTQAVRELSRSRPVLYVNTAARGMPAERVRRLAEHPRPRDLLGPELRLPLRPGGPNVTVASFSGIASVLPLGFPEPLRRHNVRLVRRAIARWLAAQGADRCLLYFHWWFLPELVEAVPHALCVYDCVDEHTAYPSSRLPADTVRRIEARLLDAVDRTFVVSPALLEPRVGPGRTVSVLSNAVDLRAHAAAMAEDAPPPPELAGIQGPVIGCVGGLGGRVDVELVRALLAARRDWTWVFVGADQPEVFGGWKDPNLVLLGPRPYHEAIRIIDRFDVATIPFLENEFTRGNSLLKLYDYLAHGMPVVATPLPDTRRADAGAPGLLRLPGGRDEWLPALADAVAEPADDPRRERRRAYAHERSSERRVATIVSEGLAARRARA